jgi:uncharacterized membrane protein
LTVIYSAERGPVKTPSRPAAMLPLLVILFIVSYCILTMLVFEQGQTIESQRSLIREMLKDSTQLAALKDKQARDDSKRIQDQAAAPDDQKTPDVSAPAASEKTPESKGSDAKGTGKDTKKPSKSARSAKPVPQRPAADLEDVRRLTHVI